MSPRLTISIGQHSDPGIKGDNEDFYGMRVPQPPQLARKGIAIAIADGMSGSDAGKIAARASVIGFLSDYFSTPDSWTVKHSARKILSAINGWLYSNGHSLYASPKGMVTTLTVLILKSNAAYIFHVGDTRIYRLREDCFERLTRDHRVRITGERIYLNRAMGIEPRVEVDHRSLPLQRGDIFLLTSDGVHDFVGDKELKRLLLENQGDLQLACERVVASAKRNASDDNLTCQAVRIDTLPLEEESELPQSLLNRPFPPFLREGMVLDGYRIEAELHASKRTQIYRAFDTQNRKTVVLKTPSVNYEDDPAYIERFLYEEWAGRRIDHENVLRVLDCDRPKRWLYYVTEYVDGQTLRQWMDKHPHPNVGSVIAMLEQIGKGLRALHKLEMLHQDLKPENVMIDQRGALKIIDFGSVKIGGISEMKPDEPCILGTRNYTAPEYLLGRPGDPRSDLYALAVIAYELLNGALPYGNKDLPNTLSRSKLARLEYVASIHHNPMVPVWIDGAIRKSVAINPRLRHQDIAEFLYDLKHPNPRFMNQRPLPLLQRDPLTFWKCLCALLALANLILLILLAG